VEEGSKPTLESSSNLGRRLFSLRSNYKRKIWINSIQIFDA
jgi:hypothetical protein